MRIDRWLLFINLFPALASAQLDLFTGAAFEHEVTPKWGYEMEVEHRQILNTGNENRVLLLAAANYLIGNQLSITPGVRLTPDYGQGPSELRIFTDLNATLPLGKGPFSLEGRLRNQYEIGLGKDGGMAEVATRPRLGLAYAAHDLTTLVLEYELRYRFDRLNRVVQQRHTLGISQDISTRISLEVFFRIERDNIVPGEEASLVTGIYLNYVLPDRRDRDRDWEYRRPFGRSLLW